LLGDHVGIVAPAFLIFYGLALINASPNLYEEIRYLVILKFSWASSAPSCNGMACFVGRSDLVFSHPLWRRDVQEVRCMKNPFESLDKILEHRVRLQIMSVLVVNDRMISTH